MGDDVRKFMKRFRPVEVSKKIVSYNKAAYAQISKQIHQDYRHQKIVLDRLTKSQEQLAKSLKKFQRDRFEVRKAGILKDYRFNASLPIQKFNKLHIDDIENNEIAQSPTHPVLINDESSGTNCENRIPTGNNDAKNDEAFEAYNIEVHKKKSPIRLQREFLPSKLRKSLNTKSYRIFLKNGIEPISEENDNIQLSSKYTSSSTDNLAKGIIVTKIELYHPEVDAIDEVENANDANFLANERKVIKKQKYKARKLGKFDKRLEKYLRSNFDMTTTFRRHEIATEMYGDHGEFDKPFPMYIRLKNGTYRSELFYPQFKKQFKLSSGMREKYLHEKQIRWQLSQNIMDSQRVESFCQKLDKKVGLQRTMRISHFSDNRSPKTKSPLNLTVAEERMKQFENKGLSASMMTAVMSAEALAPPEDLEKNSVESLEYCRYLRPKPNNENTVDAVLS